MSQTCNTGEEEIECPWCGEINDWSDVRTDGCLTDGYEDKCRACQQSIRIDAVDWEPTIWVSRKEEHPTTGEER